MKNAISDADSEPLPDPYRRNAVWWTLQFLARLTFPVWFGVRTRGIQHIPARGGALLVINHLSFLDPLIVSLSISRPVSYVARDSLFRVPIVGWILRHTYVFPINRDAASSTTIREGVRRLLHGFLLGIFPEGTRGDGSGIQELKPGFLSLVRRSQVPVIPVAVAGTDAALPRDAHFPRRRRVYVLYGEPISAAEIEQHGCAGQQDCLIDLVRQRMIQCRDEAEAWRRHAESSSVIQKHIPAAPADTSTCPNPDVTRPGQAAPPRGNSANTSG